jgi:UDP-N-acetylmuramate--alanine ligase
MSSSSSQPLTGRRFWIAGIGGAGMSAYALVAHAWGAEVVGWDRVETPYLAHLDGIDVTIAPEPPPPPTGFEVYVSTAFANRVAGRPRADLLAELVSLRRAIVVAGAHGKTTTSAMIAFCLDRLGDDPSFLIGGEVPQLDGNARAGTGWLVVEGDESDGTVAQLRPEIGVLLNVDLDVHSPNVATRSSLEAMFDEWLTHVPQVVRAEELAPVDLELRVPGEHNRRNAAAALAAVELTGVARADAERALIDFAGVGRRLEEKGEAGGIRVYDSYAHHPAELAADLAAIDGRVLALFQPHLYSRTRYLAHGFARALADAHAVCVTDIYPAREEPIPGVTGRLVVEELAALRPGMRIGWAPEPEQAARFVAGWARPGDAVLTLGAGDVDRVAPLLLELLA